MLGETEDGSDKWTRVKQALTSFLDDPQSAGLGVGIQYFPLLRPGVPDVCQTDGQCVGAGPCDILRTCSASAMITPCLTNGDCRGMGMCVRLGICGDSSGVVSARESPRHLTR